MNLGHRKIEMEETYKVGGMTCGGCVRSVTNALERLSPEIEVEVSLENGSARVRGDHSEGTIKQAIEDAGFDYGGIAS